MLINRRLALEALSRGEPLKGVVNRGTGRTTAAILAAISEGIRRPGEHIVVQDESTPNNHSSLEHLRYCVEDTVRRLGLKEIRVHIHTTQGPAEHRQAVAIINYYSERLA